MRRFAILGSTARADAGFNLNDVAGTSGRLDVLLRCIRAAMMASHGLREEVVVYLVLGAGPRAPRTVRLDSAGVRFLRPDERSLAVLLRKVLETDYGLPTPEGSVEVARTLLALRHEDASRRG